MGLILQPTRHQSWLWGMLGFLILMAPSAGAEVSVPVDLRPWVQWVLRDHDERACPVAYNDGAQHQCAWPGELELFLDSTGGRFRQRWEVYAKGPLALPGSPEHWPQAVQVNGHTAVVGEHKGRPAVFLEDAGAYVVSGTFSWEQLPDSLAVPSEIGLIALEVDGEIVAFPDLTRQGQLWLRQRTEALEAERDGDRVSLQVFRRLVDEAPFEVVTRLDLQVSGAQREAVVGPVLLPEFLPVELTSPLPARLESDGRIRVQLRPGRWTLTLRARHSSLVGALPVQLGAPPWPETEVWVWDARNHLRLVEPGGLVTVDPRQTTLPAEWQHLPAFLAEEGQTLNLTTVRRGDPEPEPDRVQLSRILWLDFDGTGYTVQDTLRGKLSRGWRLEAGPGLDLGRAAVDGVPQFITRRDGRTGVEVRRGELNLLADSRWEGSVRHFPAVGWEQDVQSLRATLHVPPGWEVFSVGGTDNRPHTWLARWSLLDLFLVLIASVAAFRLWGWGGGTLTVVTLALVWHAPGAPRWVWLHLLAASALLTVVPAGQLRRWLNTYRILALVTLGLILIPFSIQQVKTGLFPSLEQPYRTMVGPASMAPRPSPVAPGEAALEMAEDAAEPMRDRGALYEVARKGLGSMGSVQKSMTWQMRHDPNANVQTGPGLPRWNWSTITLDWNGPVDRQQEVSIVFISPALRLVLQFSRVLLAAALGIVFIATTMGGRLRLNRRSAPTATALVLVAAGVVGSGSTTVHAQFPTEKLLEELQTRLLEPAACLPHCATAPRLLLEIRESHLNGRLEVHAREDVAVPIPGSSKHWLPTLVTVDGEPAKGLYRTPQDELWLPITAGIHQVAFGGPLPVRSTVQLPLVLVPRRVEVDARGWAVDGVHENGRADAQLQLTRVREEATSQDAGRELEPGALPPFVRVERFLTLDLDWRVATRVVRLSPVGTAAVIEVPLLEGEAVTTPGVRTQEGHVLVNLPPQGRTLAWESTLEQEASIKLAAPQTTEWIEAWTLDPGPIWHVERIEGLAVVHHQSPEGAWLPQWRPFPGESVEITITRPEGVPGNTITIDQSQLHVAPGQRATDATLQLSLRSSLGGQHTLVLPEGAELQKVTIQGVAQPIRQEGRFVTLPVVPGAQEVELTYRTPQAVHALFATDPPDLGQESVNHTTRMELGSDRWTLLTWGPRLGPAVQFWGALVVVALAALVLGRVPFTPLGWWQWGLLGIGFTQSPLPAAALVVGWLLALGGRSKFAKTLSPSWFNALQVGLAVLTLAALVALFEAVRTGLLGVPQMMVAGNSSSAWELNWFADRVATTPPRCTVITLPLLAYRLSMLAWALWLAFSLLSWLRWGWENFSRDGLWQSMAGARFSLDRLRRNSPPPTDTEAP